ncbi:hypothetical protein BDZ88DRAFT_430390 [Geranomyces variabilis]|nr:hypothetical protein BDZ88DRAFT_430390 [Geranomyces variabilis]KAJ3139973.1 hypothetical protein HDU90_008876 [Geranomyces variabilis]
MPGHDFHLPPCSYPTAKPYSSFTTLLHRFGRYERERMKALLEAAAHANATVGPSGRCVDDKDDCESLVGGGGRVRRMASGGLAGAREMSMDSLGKQIMNAAAAEMNNQRVALTPKQELKMELAKIKTAVDQLSRDNNCAVSTKQNVYPNTNTPPQQQPQPSTKPSSGGGGGIAAHREKPPLAPLHNPNSLTASEKQKFMFVNGLMSRLDQRKGG